MPVEEATSFDKRGRRIAEKVQSFYPGSKGASFTNEGTDLETFLETFLETNRHNVVAVINVLMA